MTQTIMTPENETVRPADRQVVVVETNNFRQVLEHFDKDGHVIDPEGTRFAVTCQICHEKDLALVNPRLDRRSRAAHEPYAVLPRCGHAFGYQCLYTWLLVSSPINPTCPACRAPVFCPWGHRTLGEVRGAAADDDEQHEEVVEIGREMADPRCKRCTSHPLFCRYCNVFHGPPSPPSSPPPGSPGGASRRASVGGTRLQGGEVSQAMAQIRDLPPGESITLDVFDIRFGPARTFGRWRERGPGTSLVISAEDYGEEEVNEQGPDLFYADVLGIRYGNQVIYGRWVEGPSGLTLLTPGALEGRGEDEGDETAPGTLQVGFEHPQRQQHPALSPEQPESHRQETRATVNLSVWLRTLLDDVVESDDPDTDHYPGSDADPESDEA